MSNSCVEQVIHSITGTPLAVVVYSLNFSRMKRLLELNQSAAYITFAFIFKILKLNIQLIDNFLLVVPDLVLFILDFCGFLQ